ncbi:MAG: hypothetical protein ABI878_01290 [Acidobacteriota bacterium]
MGETWLDARSWYYKPSVGNRWDERFRGKRFDSYLGRSSHPTQNHVLKLFLRIYLNPVKKSDRPSGIDGNKKSFPLKDWTPKGFAKFREEFEKQSRLWNHRFWLVPPKFFTIGDISQGGRFVRPNIACMLFTELTESPGSAHRTVDAYNIDVDEVKRRDDADDDNPYLGNFRSNDRHITARDVNTGPRTYEINEEGDTYRIEHHYTIAHEIGHAIGLPHIGVAKHTKECAMALQFAKDKTPLSKVPLEKRGGRNADVCYGTHDSANLIVNIMGKGYKFEEINAVPWKKRVAIHTNTLASDWKVSLVMLHPQAVSEKDRHAVNQRKWISM